MKPAPALLSWLLALLMTLLVAGCGPGVGGTGTGEDPVTALGARPANVCTSEIAALLDCAPAPPALQPAPGAQDDRPLWFADSTSGRQAVARFAGQAVVVELRCPGLRFEGRWGESGELGGRYFGTLASEPSAPLASLQVRRDGDVLVVQLVGQGGVALGAPLRLVRVPAPPPIASC